MEMEVNQPSTMENICLQVHVANHPQQIDETETDQQNGEDVENGSQTGSHGPHATVGGSPQNDNIFFYRI